MLLSFWPIILAFLGLSKFAAYSPILFSLFDFCVLHACSFNSFFQVFFQVTDKKLKPSGHDYSPLLAWRSLTGWECFWNFWGGVQQVMNSGNFTVPSLFSTFIFSLCLFPELWIGISDSLFHLASLTCLSWASGLSLWAFLLTLFPLSGNGRVHSGQKIVTSSRPCLSPVLHMWYVVCPQACRSPFSVATLLVTASCCHLGSHRHMSCCVPASFLKSSCLCPESPGVPPPNSSQKWSH